MLRLISLPLLCLFCLPLSAQGEDLAAGRPCAFAPVPNYALTAEGGTDSADLTDGRVVERPDQHIWFESHAVGWSYVPLINVRLDLGEVQPISEVVMRFLGGSAQPGLDFPGFVRVLVSDDDATYYLVGEYSKWRQGDDARYGIPVTAGQAWVHPLRFADLRTRGRYVGLAIGGTALTCSDELYVYRGDHDPAAVGFAPEQALDFSVSRPQVAFVKPTLVLTSNIATPQPIVLLDESGKGQAVSLHIQTPAGVEIVAGRVGGTAVPDAAAETTADGAHYSVAAQAPGTTAMPWGKLMMQARLPAGTQTTLRCWLEWGEGKSGVVTIPVTVEEIAPAPRCKRMMMALGWWSMEDTRAWPEGLRAAEIIGLNTLSTFAHWMDKQDQGLWDFADQARQQGFRLLNVDSPWHHMLSRHEGDPTLFCQFADGTTGKHFCPSYRGPAYAEELKRVADECARLRPDCLSADVELWSWTGPVDAEKCTRCQADKLKSGIATWEEWKLAKGYEMWKDLHTAVQEAVQAGGGRPVEMGAYDWRPAKSYQFTWPFDRLYQDKLLGNSQASTYTPLLPYHIELVGDRAREDRAHLPRTEGLPWLTPGDAGAFTAEALRCAMLECFLNGSRGIHFWSSRYWDGEYLLGYNEAVRTVAAIEDIIVDGDLYGEAAVERPARVSGMRRGDDIALLVGHYYGSNPVTVQVTLDVPAASDVVDTESGQTIGELAAGTQTLAVKLEEHRSRVLWVRGR